MPKFKRKITKRYLNTLCDKIAYFFYTYGTLRAVSLDYVAMALGVENDDFLIQGLRQLDKENRITLDVDAKKMEWVIDFLPF